MDSSQRPDRLTALQRELLDAFFAREQRFFLTGGGALAGFYLGHRSTEDLDLFSPPGPDLDDGVRAMQDAATSCRASSSMLRSFEAFKRLLVTRGDEQCVVDIVIEQVSIGPEALLPGEADPISLDAFRADLVVRLRAIAFRQGNGSPLT
jgi:hypothetical protein